MSYDEDLATRVRLLLATKPSLDERRMFGGLSFLLQGNFCCGVQGRELVVRVGQEAVEATLQERHTRPMDFTGRPMKGWLYVASEGLVEDADLARWVERGSRFALSLPPGGARTRRRAAGRRA